MRFRFISFLFIMGPFAWGSEPPNLAGLWHLSKVECEDGSPPALDGYDPTSLYMNLAGGKFQTGRLSVNETQISPVFEESEYAVSANIIVFSHRFFNGVGIMKEARLEQVVGYSLNDQGLKLTLQNSPVCPDHGEVDSYTKK